MTIRHNGSPTFRDANYEEYVFTHQPRNTLFEYDITKPRKPVIKGDLGGGMPTRAFTFVEGYHMLLCTDSVRTPNTLCTCVGQIGEEYIGLSYASWWTVDFTFALNNDLVDVSKVSGFA